MNTLEIKDLYLTAGSKILLENFSVRMQSGETWVILGTNGSGKTTLLHTLAGLNQAKSGSVLLNDKAIEKINHRQRARSIGILFQDYESIFPGTVMETVLVSRYPFSGWAQLLGDSVEDRQIAHSALQQLNLESLSERSMTSLSGGERRRVQMAALIAQTTPIRLLDEPTNHLDLHQQENILNHIARSNKNSAAEENLNVMVLHDINQALRHGTHGILLFADGSGIAGKLNDIVDKNSLERLYGCALTELKQENQSYYFPG